jgi:regulator of sirC expression with transglutaminase-like and TPR domain
MTLPNSEPAVCAKRAYHRLQAELPRLESTDGLLFGATAIAMHSMSDVNQVTIDREIQRLVDRARARTPDLTIRSRVETIHAIFSQEEGFSGNYRAFNSPLNYFTSFVMTCKKGNALSLGVFYKVITERLCTSRVEGIDTPYFLLRVHSNGHYAYVDPFRGEILSQEEAIGRVVNESAGGNFNTSDPLPAMTNRRWLQLMLTELRDIYRELDSEDSLAMEELLELLDEK